MSGRTVRFGSVCVLVGSCEEEALTAAKKKKKQSEWETTAFWSLFAGLFGLAKRQIGRMLKQVSIQSSTGSSIADTQAQIN